MGERQRSTESADEVDEVKVQEEVEEEVVIAEVGRGRSVERRGGEMDNFRLLVPRGKARTRSGGQLL